MDIRQLTAAERDLWASFVQSRPEGSLWQSPAWEAFQRALGRQTRVYAALEGVEIKAAALVVIDRTTGGFSTWDIPRGPIGDEVTRDQGPGTKLLKKILEDAKKERCLSLYFSPLVIGHWSLVPRARASARHEQPEATRILDLTLDEDALLAQMHPKGRYNIKVAQKHGVTVAQSTDVAAFHRLMAQTGERDAFGILPLRHYKTFLETIPGAFLLLAYEGMSNEKVAMSNAPDTTQTPIAGLLGVVTGGRGVYYYGASNYAHRASMAPYLLQWEAMRRCKAAGCRTYDLLGIEPPPSDQGPVTNDQNGSQDRERLLGHWSLGFGHSTDAKHPWSGVSRFKAQFGGTVVSYPHEQCLVLRPMLLWLLQLKRRFI